jgi:Putative lumazine-binding
MADLPPVFLLPAQQYSPRMVLLPRQQKETQMKSRILSVATFAATLLTGACQNSLDATPDALIAAVRGFYAAGDAQDAAALEAALHPQFRVVALDYPAPGETGVIDRALYLTLIREKKFGGDPRTVTIDSVRLHGDRFAAVQVSASARNSGLQFLASMTLVRQGQTWLVLQDAVAVKTPATAPNAN